MMGATCKNRNIILRSETDPRLGEKLLLQRNDVLSRNDENRLAKTPRNLNFIERSEVELIFSTGILPNFEAERINEAYNVLALQEIKLKKKNN